MDYRRILVRFEGRIGRGRYLLASLIILASMISALALLAGICLGLGIPTGPLNINVIGISASFQLDDDDVAVKAGLFPHIANILLTLIFAWFYAAASIRRLHDRNKSGWWMVPFTLSPASTVNSAVGLADRGPPSRSESWCTSAFSGAWSRCIF
jgi:uncharacterized membrane protein YhaH (DUF805 family)